MEGSLSTLCWHNESATRFMEMQGLWVTLICSGVCIFWRVYSWIYRGGRCWCSHGLMSGARWISDLYESRFATSAWRNTLWFTYLVRAMWLADLATMECVGREVWWLLLWCNGSCAMRWRSDVAVMLRYLQVLCDGALVVRWRLICGEGCLCKVFNTVPMVAMRWRMLVVFFFIYGLII